MGPLQAGADMEINVNHLGELAKLAVIMRVYVSPVMEAIGQDLRKAAVDAIRLQKPPGGGTWEALDKEYKSWKTSHGLSENIYTMTGTYMQNIASVYNTSTMTLEVGVFRGIMHPGVKSSDSGKGSVHAVELSQIAQVLEYGYLALNIRPRPLWRPLLIEKEHAIKTKVGIAIHQALKHVARHKDQFPNFPGAKP